MRSTSVARIYLLIRPKVSFTTTFKVKWVVGFVRENSNFAMCMDQGGVDCCLFFRRGFQLSRDWRSYWPQRSLTECARKKKRQVGGDLVVVVASNSRFHHHHHHHYYYHHHYLHPHHHHQALSRVVAVSGDITEDRLGLCPEEENLLAQTVTAIARIIMRMIVGMVKTMILLSP